MKTSAYSSIEPLEARIAPALTFINGGLGATFTDADGDFVTIKVTVGDLTNHVTTSGAGVVGGEKLEKLDFTSGTFDGSDLTITVAKKPGGDGLVSVGDIDSTGFDLGKVTIKGDLAQLEVGDTGMVGGVQKEADGSMKSLTVTSLGKYAVSGSALIFQGSLGALTVAGDMRDVVVTVQATNAVDANLGPVTIGGSLLGGAGDFSGSILAQGQIGPVKIGKDAIAGSGGQSAFIRSLSSGITSVSIGGSLIGGDGNSTGTIEAFGVLGPVVIKGSVIGHDGLGSGEIVTDFGDITSVTIGGSLIGGNGTSATGVISAGGILGPVKIGGDVKGGAGGGGGFFSGNITASEIKSLSVAGSLIGGAGAGSGSIFSSKIGKTTIGKNILGGTGANSGRLESGSNLLDTTVGGSLIGGSANGAGQIIAGGNLPVLTIKGSLIGGSIIANDITNISLDRTGYIQANHIGKVTIGGSIIAGADKALLGTLTKSGSIRAVEDIDSLTVKGSLIGQAGVKGDSPVVISARGNGTTHLGIGKITVGGSVSRANILGGFGVELDPLDGDAQIGAVSVGSDWSASTLTAGVQNLGADDAAMGTGANADNVNFGDAHDVLIANTTGLAAIASIQIKGLVIGSTVMNDHFGFMSHKIGSFKAGGVTVTIPAVNQFTQLSPVTGDVAIHIV